MWVQKSDANLRSCLHPNLRAWSRAILLVNDGHLTKMQPFWPLCPAVLLAMACVGPLQKMCGTKRKAVCVLRQVDDSSEEDVWDKEKETFRVYEARVITRPLILQRCG